jgi:hypothetical protein
MKPYDVYLEFAFTRHVQVMAESESKAEEKALSKKGHVTMCPKCSRNADSDLELKTVIVEEKRLHESH